ncbi:MAG: hypothetical protein ACR2FX_04090 [Chthoniobacterales bacterium]
MTAAVPLFGAPNPNGPSPAVQSAWLDLRQNAKTGAVQNAPAWIADVTLTPGEKRAEPDSVHIITAPKGKPTVFRIRVKPPDEAYKILFVRVFFNDQPDARPAISMWDPAREQLLRFGPLGAGVEVESSDSCLIPIEGTRNIDLEVPGDGGNVRSAFLQWMTSGEVVHEIGASSDATVPAPFSPALRLGTQAEDLEQFGTVTAMLSPDIIRIGPTLDEAAVYQFGVESQPLLALISFEVAQPRISSPPEVYVNGNNVGEAALMLPALADPGYRGEMRALMHEMDFEYTGWVRAQKVVPVSVLQTGHNSLSVMNGHGAGNAAIRGAQIQLKYLWDKSDYILKPAR